MPGTSPIECDKLQQKDTETVSLLFFFSLIFSPPSRPSRMDRFCVAPRVLVPTKLLSYMIRKILFLPYLFDFSPMDSILYLSGLSLGRSPDEGVGWSGGWLILCTYKIT